LEDFSSLNKVNLEGDNSVVREGTFFKKNSPDTAGGQNKKQKL